MTDDLKLIERLREDALHLSGRGIDRGCVDSSLSGGLADEAADAIERLTRDLKNARYYTVPIHKDGNWVFIDGPGDVELDHGGKMRTEIDHLAAQVEEMRAALVALLSTPALADENHDDPTWGCAETSAAITRARALLQRTQEASDA